MWFICSILIPSKEVHHIVLISIDTCRADFLSCYGYSGQTTPHIDGLAAEAVLFESAVSPSPMTLPGHSSMLTGTLPPAHGVHDNIGYQLGLSNTTLAELLTAKGFATGAVISAFVLDAQFGLDQGFDTYNDEFDEELTVGVDRRRGDETTGYALQWLDKHAHEKSFLFLHYYDPHMPYDPPPPFDARFPANPYAGEVAYTDHQIGKVIAKLKELELYDDTLIIITSDHGEMHKEHGETTHGYFIYESAIKIPLIFKLPGQNKQRRIDQLVGLVDIVPTVCTLAGLDVPADVRGRDLSDTLRNGKYVANEPRYMYCEAMLSTRYKANSLLGIRDDRWKYIQTTRPELYDLQADPKETRNLLVTEHKRAGLLRKNLELILTESQNRRTESKMVPDEKTTTRLEALGYVAGREITEAFDFESDKPDPKDWIEFHETNSIASHLIRHEKYDQARAVCEKMIRQDPGFAMTYFYLGKIAHAQGETDKTIDYYSKSLRLNPDQYNVHNKLGDVYYKIQDRDSAAHHLSESIRIKPAQPDALNGLAWLKAAYPDTEFYDPPQALRLAQQCCELTRFEHPGYLDTLAVAYAASGNFVQAIETAERALERAHSENKQKLAANITNRLEQYRKKQPYIEQ